MIGSKSALGIGVRLLNRGTFVGIIAIMTVFSFGEDGANDPILGRWRWHNNAALVFHADGTVGLSAEEQNGTWKCVSPKNQDPRKYILN
jgi:hypothetical protein